MRVLICVPVLAAGLFSGLQPGAAENLLRNPSFERVTGEGPIAWRWAPGGARATLQVDTTRAHHGKVSVRIVNAALQAPHVYGPLMQTVAVHPGETYTVSCYVWTEGAGRTWIGGGAKWQFRFPFPQRTHGWQRVTGTFTADAASFTVRILTESPTKGVWVDDVQLERGPGATPFNYAAPLPAGECRLQVHSYVPPPNLAPNPSFEVLDGVRPKHWMWDRRNTDATMTVDAREAHSGRRSIFITNGTRFASQVYGWFGVVGGVAVKPDTVYTLSAYVRAENPGAAWVGGGKGWRIRCAIPATGDKWERIQKTFTTLPDEASFPLMVVTESPTSGFHVDDIRLEAGPRATPFVAESERRQARLVVSLPPPPTVSWRGRVVNTAWAPGRYPPDTFVFTEGTVRFTAEGFLPHPPGKVVVRVRLLDAAGKVVLTARTRTVIARPGFVVETRANPGGLPAQALRAEVAVSAVGDPRPVVQGWHTFQLVTARAVRDRVHAVRNQRSLLAALVQALDKQGAGDYGRVVLTVDENFLPWIQEDLAHGVIDRAWDQVVLLDVMTRNEIRTGRAVLTGKRPRLVTPRYRTGPIRIAGPSFIATRRYPDGSERQGPVFFVGYGHFGQVRADVEKFPGYGCNLIQIEFGPRSVLPAEGKVSLTAVTDFLKVCDRAAKAGVAVNLLLSPHYFPDWAYAKWPWLPKCHGGFFKYCVHAPESRTVLKKFFEVVIPRVGRHAALHSLCLSNEPICTDLTGCRITEKTWPEWLRSRYHGLSAALNAAWGTRYPGFAQVPIPPPRFTAEARSYDFMLFNQETFAGFHRWMADVIHGMAPQVPVHAKIMMSAHFGRNLGGMWSVSPELFARLSRINGNDACCWYRRRGEFASAGPGEAMAYDFQRSMADLPVFNSENHLILDRDRDVIPPEHVYATLWQGAIHGQSATTIWVWERSFDPTASTAGSILHRPDCVAAVGRACLDLNRLAEQVTAFQKLRPQVVFLWSPTSVVYNDDYPRRLTGVYRTADFLGLPLGFVTERQLVRAAAGESIPPLAAARVVVAVDVTHTPDSTLTALQQFVKNGGRVVSVGTCFGRDEHGKPRSHLPAFGESLRTASGSSRALFSRLGDRLTPGTTKPEAVLLDRQGNPVFGVEYRSVRIDGRLFVNACNYLTTVQEVRLQVDGKPLPHVQDTIAGVTVSPPLRLAPLRPVLLRVGE